MIVSLLLALASTANAAAQPAEGACEALLDQRKVFEERLADLVAERLPEEHLRDLVNFLNQIREAVGGTHADAKKLSEGRLKGVATRLEPVAPKIGAAVAEIAKGVVKWTGKAAEAIAVLDSVVPELERWIDRLESAETDTAAEQILALKAWFDELRVRTRVDDVPGLGQLLEVYSSAIGGIAESERIREVHLRRVDDIHRQVYDKPLYLRARSPREQLADARQGAIAALEHLDAQLEAAGCDRKPPHPSLCEKPRGHIDRGVAAARAATQSQRQLVSAIQRRVREDERAIAVAESRRDTLAMDARFAAQRVRNWIGRPNAVYDRLVTSADAAAAAEVVAEQELTAAFAAAIDPWLDLRLARRNEQRAVELELGKTPWTGEDLLFLRACLDERYVPSLPRSPAEATMAIHSRMGWQKSGVTVVPGDSVVVAAYGQIRYSQRDSAPMGGTVGPDGITAQTEDLSSYSVRSEWSHGAVIARIGGDLFYIGPGAAIAATKAGEVEIRVNDTDLGNNEGAFSARIVRLP